MNLQRTLIALAAWALLAPAAAVAAAPGASTGTATDVTATTATLTGTVNPNKEVTTYYFEYGTTTAYGSRTPDQTVGGNAGKSVEATITGLAPNTTYHFRLVARNPSGRDTGDDATFTTLADYVVPGANAITCAARPARITFGRSTTISGQLTGPDNGGVKVQLEQDPVPYGDGFKKTGPGATTDANGFYSITVAPGVNTRYQVVAKSSPSVTCAAVQVLVRHKVGLRVSDNKVRRGQRVRFSGAVRPAHTGKVRIQRRVKGGGWRTVAKAKLRPKGNRSTYSKRLRIFRKGTYRAKMNRDAEHIAGVSRKRTIRIG